MNSAVAVFRPDDERIEEAVEVLENLGVEAVPDPMLAVEPIGETPRTDADYVVLTSTTGVELAAGAGWTPGDATLCAIGPKTAAAAERAGFEVDVVPEDYTSAGLVAALEDVVDGATVEVARSDHGSRVLVDGLESAGAVVHETVLYRLVRPAGAGSSIDRLLAGDLDGVCFTSSLTVEHFLDAADERDVAGPVREALDDATVGCIGPPTRETAANAGVAVDVVAEEATFESLARAVVGALG
ncbi:MAG: uroporphyrinogen-III synthase [Halanaeroarchaeum sp.]